MPQAVIAGVSSGIGSAIAERLAGRGWNVAGTSRRALSHSLAEHLGTAVICDFVEGSSVDSATREIVASTMPWDALILAPGTMNPIGPFAEVDFDQWAESVDVNVVNQLRFVHGLLGHANHGTALTPKCVFFAGGGTNSASPAFSAYVMSKIALIKATELLDAEIPNMAFTIVGPGWVRTDIHEETLSAALAPPAVIEETRRRLEADDFVDMSEVLAAVDWVLEQPKEVVGGRNFSVTGDPMGEPAFPGFLAADPSLFKLRRWGNDAYWTRHES
jgi:NAD(P)-dependent dehydrogenase (short-subunit alcohol dehydrogenase family)